MLSPLFDSLDAQTRELLPHVVFGMANSLMLMTMKYKQLKKLMIDWTFNTPEMHENDYPIILVHGYCGSTMDENWILGGYFHYAFSKTARYLGLDHNL